MLGGSCSSCCRSICVRPLPPVVYFTFRVLDGMNGAYPPRQADARYNQQFIAGFEGYDAFATPHILPVYFGGTLSQYESENWSDPDTLRKMHLSGFGNTEITSQGDSADPIASFARLFFSTFTVYHGPFSFTVSQRCEFRRRFAYGETESVFSSSFQLSGGAIGIASSVGTANVFGQTLTLNESNASTGATATSTDREGSAFPIEIYAKQPVYNYYTEFPAFETRYSEVKVELLEISGMFSPPFWTFPSDLP